MLYVIMVAPVTIALGVSIRALMDRIWDRRRVVRPKLERDVAEYLAYSRAMAASSNKVSAVQGKPGLPAGRI